MKKILISLCCLLAVPASANTPDPEFTDWLSDLRVEAEARGIRAEILNAAFADFTPLPRVLELDRSQPEFTQSFWTYLDRRVSASRLSNGKRLLAEHKDLLEEIEATYGVQGRFLVAFWGLETNYGAFLGGFPVVEALATLAYDPRRSAFFRDELFNALQILNEGHIALDDMKGSWAGAMGQPQFMPSTFVRHAKDRDGDGRKDIWGTLPDVFASSASFLKSMGWDNTKTWGREVRLPDDLDPAISGLGTSKLLSEWQELGLRRMDGRPLPAVDIKASLVLPEGINGPAFLVYANFRAIMGWNRSILYAISVGHLADRLAGQGALQSPRSENKPLSRDQVKTIQSALAQLGFDPGGADGQIGPRTRGAVRAFQSARNLPADSFLSQDLADMILSEAKTTQEPATTP